MRKRYDQKRGARAFEDSKMITFTPNESGLYCRAAARAIEEVLHLRRIDLYWDELKELFDRPEIKAAAEVMRRGIAEYYAPKMEEARAILLRTSEQPIAPEGGTAKKSRRRRAPKRTRAKG